MVDAVPIGLFMIFAGIIAVLVGIFASARDGEGRVKGGGVLLVGPIPIAFGSDAKWTSVAIALAVVLVFVSLLFYWRWP